MLRRFISAAVALFVFGGFVLAGDYSGLITAITKDEVKITTGGKKNKEEKTFKVSKDVKITRDGEDVSGGVEALADRIKNSKKGKGVRGKVTTRGDGEKEVVTRIALTAKKPK